MKKFLALLAVPLVLALCAAPGLAQMEMGGPMWAFGARAGYALPMGDFGDFYDGAILAGVNGCYMFTEQYGLELAVEWNKHSANDELIDDLEVLLGSGVDASFQFIPVTLDFVAGFPTGGTVTPYLKGGLGMYFWTGEIEVGSSSESVSESDFGFNAGAGLKFPVAETTVLDVGACFHNVLTEDESTQYFTASVGVMFMF